MEKELRELRGVVFDKETLKSDLSEDGKENLSSTNLLYLRVKIRPLGGWKIMWGLF